MMNNRQCRIAPYPKRQDKNYLTFLDVGDNKASGSLDMNVIEKEFAYVRKWTLETPYKSYRNHHFYEKFGFKKIGETEPDQNGFYLFLYEKTSIKQIRRSGFDKES